LEHLEFHFIACDLNIMTETNGWSGYIPSIESFDEALDDIVLKTCEALESMDGGITLLHNTLDVGIRQANKGRVEDRHDSDEMETSSEEERMTHDEFKRQARAQRTKSSADPHGDKAGEPISPAVRKDLQLELLPSTDLEAEHEAIKAEKDEQLNTLEIEIRQYIDLLHMTKGAEKSENGSEFGVWNDMRKSRAKMDKKIQDQEQCIWEYVDEIEKEEDDDDDHTVQMTPAGIKKAPAPENMMHRLRKQKPESEHARERRITDMLNALDKRMALEAFDRRKKAGEIFVPKVMGNKNDPPDPVEKEEKAEKEEKDSETAPKATFDSQKVSHDPYHDGIVHGIIDDIGVIGELGTTLMKDNCGLSPNPCSNIKLILEDTRDAFIDLPHVVMSGGEVTPALPKAEHPEIQEIILTNEPKEDDSMLHSVGASSAFTSQTAEPMQESTQSTASGSDKFSHSSNNAVAEMELNPNRKERQLVANEAPGTLGWAFCMPGVGITVIEEEQKDLDGPKDPEDGMQDKSISLEQKCETKKDPNPSPQDRGTPLVMSDSKPKSRLKISAFLEDDDESNTAEQEDTKTAQKKNEIHGLNEILPCWAPENQLTTE
jgi:hypothetical protein